MLSPLVALSFALISAAPAAPVLKARAYDAVHYRIDVRLQDKGLFENKLTLTLKPKKPLTTVELDAYGLKVQSAKVNGSEATFTRADDSAQGVGSLNVTTRQALPAGKEATVEVAYTVEAGSRQEGLFTVTPDGSDVPFYFTQFEPNFAQRFFPCNDQPDDKATTEIYAIVDGKYQVLANGTKILDEAYSDKGENLRRVHWKQDQAHPVYVVALAIGQFQPVEVGGDVPATVYVLKGQADRAFVATDITQSALATQAKFLGVKYPWAKYDQVVVPHFFWGGMENTSLVLMRENGLVLATKNHIAGRPRVVGLVAHELAHQWFGDYVTLKSWDDAWLNEGFATYLGEIAEEAYYENDSVKIDRATSTFIDYFREEDGPRSHALLPQGHKEQEGAFDDTSYTKGAHVLRMLELWVGKPQMQQGLKHYLEKYALSNASSADFFQAMGEATKQDKQIKPFKEAWLNLRGYPVLFPEANFSGNTLTVTIRQKPNHPEVKGPFVFKLPIVLHRESEPSYHKEQLVVVDKPVVTVKFDLPARPESIDWNKDGAALARVNSASVGEQEWVLAARQDPDPVWRLLADFVLLGDIANPDAVEDSQARPTETAISTLTDILATDPSPYVRTEVLQRLSRSRWKRVPNDFGPVALSLARRPDKLPEDSLGMIEVRVAAMEALGKMDYPEGRAYLIEELGKQEIDLNYLPGLAVGMAHLGDSIALATLRGAVVAQRSRGYHYFRSVAVALGSVENPDVVPALKDLVRDARGNSELAADLTRRLAHNHAVLASPEGAAFVRDFVLDDNGLGDDVKRRMMLVLDDTKTPAAKDALTSIAEKAGSERLRGSARTVLGRNFASVTPAATKPAKLKK